jgi:hypothetical protein
MSRRTHRLLIERGVVMKTRSKAAAWLLCLAALGAGGAAHAAVDDDVDALVVTALTGPQGGHITIGVPDGAGVAVFPQVHVKLIAPAGSESPQRILNLTDVPAEHGSATVAVTELERGTAVVVQAHVREQAPPRTVIHRGTTTAKLRPDLVVAAVHAPPQTLSTRAVDVVADVTELNTDVGATATATLMLGPTPLAEPKQITVGPGETTSVTFGGVVLAEPTKTELTVRLAGADPYETSTANNAGSRTIDVTAHELVTSSVLVDALGGYGAQFNGHLYAPITSPPPEALPDLESKVKALEPQFVRIFFNENWELNADRTHPEWPQNLESFKDTVQLADESGATIVLAYQTIATAKTAPATWMARFADVVQELVQVRGLTNVRWVSIANEPNSTALTLPQYEALYRAFNAELVARGLRGRIGLIGGDLIQLTEGSASGHRAWFDYMVTHMNDVVDAWSEHIYWNYWDHFRMEERLKDVAYLVRQELPPSARKPTFVMEYGVRGSDTCGTKPTVKAAYFRNAPECTELRRMSLAGFHKLWFTIASAQLGFEAAVNWDLYWSIYDRTQNNQSYWAIGPPSEGWALYPSYHAHRLILQTTARGWRVLALEPWTLDDQATPYDEPHPDQLEQELSAYNGPDGQLTLLGLDSRGGELVAPNGESSSYSIGKLPPNMDFTLALWNASGDGKNTVAATVTTNAAGVARFGVPLHAAFALTTVPVS